MSRKELLNEKLIIEEMIKNCESKLKELETNYNNFCEEYEKPMPLYYNTITQKNMDKEKSKKYTKMLINKLKNRSNKIKSGRFTESAENITIKKEVTEEIEIPYLEYA
jgi:hypothetical protein